MAHSPSLVDMTSGSIIKKALIFALPICAGNILQQLYSTVDTLVIGNYCDAAALAAVATSSQPLEILLCIFLGIGSGISILVSQAMGRNDGKRMGRLTSTAVWFLYLCAVPLSVVGVLAGPWLLKLMKVPADAMEGAVEYLRITTLGCLGNMGYNLNAGILRGLGNSSATLLLLMITCLVNIVLDLVFVAVFGMGVAGAALATAIAMIMSWLFSILYIRKHYKELAMTFLPHSYDRAMVRQILSVGLPLGLNSALYSVGHLVMQTLFNTQGSAFVAGCSVAGKVNAIANIAITSFSSAATIFAGQNLGAEDYRRLRRGALIIPVFSGAITLAAGLLLTAGCRPVLRFFTRDEQVLEMAVHYIRVVLPFTWCYAVFNGIICFVNGIGEIRYPTIVNLLMLWAVRIPAACLIGWLGYGRNVMAGIPISFVAGLLTMLLYFRTDKWKELCRKAEKQEKNKRR